MLGLIASAPALEIAMVYPSGAAFATASVPSTPPCPPRLSINTGCLISSDMRCPITRAIMSFGPPAGNGTISLIGLFGKSWAPTEAGNSSTDNPATSALRIFMQRPSQQQFAGVGNLDGPLGDKVAPHPMVMANDADGIEVGAVAQRMAVGNPDNIVMIRDRR